MAPEFADGLVIGPLLGKLGWWAGRLVGWCEASRRGPRTAPLPRKMKPANLPPWTQQSFRTDLDRAALTGKLPARFMRAER
jgi:hypothetical protein